MATPAAPAFASNSSMSAPVARRLPASRKLGYGVGDFGFGLLFLAASQFLLYYYTDVLGLSPATAGWVFGAAVVWDALIDPLMGAIANRTNSRWGRYRPYLLWGAIPLGLTWALIFLPTSLTGTALVVYAFVVHLIFRTVYTVAYMPYLALSAAMTEDSAERSTLTAFRLVLQAAAGMVVAFGTLKLVEVFGGGQVGFFKVALVYAAGAAAAIVCTFAVAREVVSGDALKIRPSLKEMIAMLRSNSAFWLACGAFLLFSVATVFFNKCLPYFMKYGLGQEKLMGPALGIYAMSITLTIPFWAQVTKRSSKRTVYLIGTALALTAYFSLWFGPLDHRFWLPLVGLLGVGSGAIFLSTWAMIPDTVEFGEWKTGVRAEGAVFGFVSFVQKASLGLAAGLLGEVLSLIGYTANVTQTPQTLASLKIVMLVVPALFAIFATVTILYYPLDAKRHGRLVRVLKWRRARTVKVSNRGGRVDKPASAP